MYRARLHGYVELLVGRNRVAAALQKIAERRFVATPRTVRGGATYIMVDQLEDLDRARERARLGDAEERTLDAYARLEERRVCGDPLVTLQPG